MPSPPPRPENRRAHPRAETDATVRILSPQTEAVLVDISRSGMLLRFERATKFRKGDELNVAFVLPGSTMKINSRLEVVRRASAQELGLRFLRLSPETLGEIDSYVARTRGG